MARLFDKEPLIKVNARKLDFPYTLVNTVCWHYKDEFCCIPEGFEWNGSDIPKILWSIIGSQHEPQFLPASLIHDYALHKKYQYEKLGVYKTTNALRVTLIEYGVHPIKAQIMATAVLIYQLVLKYVKGVKESGWRK